jgi:peptidoglycan-associated lipoprotein
MVTAAAMIRLDAAIGTLSAAKGGIMVTRSLHLVLASGLILSVVLAGCAKRPATTQAQAPAPSGAVSSTGPAPSAPSSPQPQPAPRAGGPAPSAPATAAPQNPTASQRPAIKEFLPVPELKEIYFEFDKFDVRPEDAKILDSNAQWLKSNDNLVLIEGHCDERGTNEYNLALGERRAKAAMNYLVAQGVQASRITIISYGEERPACTDHTEECWAKNRRAKFLVKPR